MAGKRSEIDFLGMVEQLDTIGAKIVAVINETASSSDTAQFVELSEQAERYKRDRQACNDALHAFLDSAAAGDVKGAASRLREALSSYIYSMYEIIPEGTQHRKLRGEVLSFMRKLNIPLRARSSTGQNEISCASNIKGAQPD